MKTALLAPLLLISCIGCANQTPQQKLYLARQSYIGTEKAATALIRAKVITNITVIDAMEAARNEARDALAEADAKIGTIGFDFVMNRVESALGRFAQFYLEHRPALDAPAEPGATSWTPSRSSQVLPRSLPSSKPLAKRSLNFSPVRT